MLDPLCPSLSRDKLESCLPFTLGDFRVRAAEREDITRRAAWPSYPPPYAMFDTKLRGCEPERADRIWLGQLAATEELFLAVDGPGCDLVAWFVLREIDWRAGKVGNMSIRLHPDYCDRGIGTALATGIFRWCHEHGFEGLRLDVLATNARAIRCYEKAGMSRTGVFEVLGEAFYWMESRTGPRPPTGFPESGESGIMVEVPRPRPEEA